MSLPSYRRVRSRGRVRGATALEFAVIAPILFAVVFALVEFSHAWFLREAANDAAREAARSAMAWGGGTGFGDARANKVLSSVGANNWTTTYSPANVTDDTTQVTVTVQLPYNDNSILPAPLFMGNAVIEGSATLACEQYRAVHGLYTRPALPTPPEN
jgi:Flp pilus assembly protein TadG